MKRQIVAMFLVGGLVLGLCGCGGSSSSDAAPAPPAEVESASTTTTDEVMPEESNEPDVEEYSTEDLGLDVEQPETDSENKSVTNDIDTSSLLTTHVIEFKDADGYDIRETIQLSPIFREDDMETVHALWEALGNDAASFPSEESLCNANRTLTNYEMEYVVGAYMVENLTEGFSITSDNPRTYTKSLTAKGSGNAITLFNDQSVSVVAYSNGVQYYSGHFAAVLSEAKMESDAWGPCSFVIVLPNTHTPNQPDGHRYDEVQLIFGYNIYGSYDHSNYDTLQLEYFMKEVD